MLKEIMETIFRKALPSDAIEIQRLYLELVQDPNIHVDSDSIANLANDDFNILVVGEKSGAIVATALITICRDVMYRNQPFAVVENVIVTKTERGNGVGAALMAWIKSKAKSLQCTKIMLLSSSKRPDAHRFFERCGYSGEMKRGFVNYINR